MKALLLMALLSGADDLASTKLNGLGIKLPAAWEKAPNKDGVRYDAPSKDAWLELSVYKVDPKRDAEKCMDQLLAELGEGWTRIKVAGQPAAQQVNTASGTGEDDEGEIEVDVQSATFVGCNGSLKWVMTVAANKKQKSRYDALTEKMLQSIQYPK